MAAPATIVIPTFNRVHFLRRAIDAALAQTVPCEVIVCDHGSTDATPELAREYAGRIRYVRRDRDEGPVACWRDGIAHATGDLLALNYDDDWLAPTFVEECRALLRPEVGFVYSRITLHDASGAVVGAGNRHPPGVRPMREIVNYLLRTPLTISPGCALFRRTDALAHLLPDVPGASGLYGKRSGVGEDLLLFLLTSLHYGWYGHVARPLAHFSAHAGSITIDAGASRVKARALAAAYHTAKEHYWTQPGSVPRRAAPLRVLDALRWRAAAGTLLDRPLALVRMVMKRLGARR